MTEEIKLPPETLGNLKEMSRIGKNTLKFIERVKRTGLDVGTQEQTIKNQVETVRRIRDEFFPGEKL